MLRSNQQREEGDGTGLSRKRCLLGSSSVFSMWTCCLFSWLFIWLSHPVGICHPQMPVFTLYPPLNSFSWLLSTPPHQITVCRNPNVSVIFTELSTHHVQPLWKFNEINRCIRRHFKVTAVHSWIIWLKDGILGTQWGDGVWLWKLFMGSHSSLFFPYTCWLIPQLPIYVHLYLVKIKTEPMFPHWILVWWELRHCGF